MNPYILTGGALAALYFLTKGGRVRGKKTGPMAKGQWIPSSKPNATQMLVWQGIRREAYGVVPHVTVTSGTRSHSQQAKAMWNKVDRYGPSSLDIYPRSIREAVLSGGSSVEGFTATIEALASKGISVSRHHAGRALDLRIRDLSQAQRVALQAAADRAVPSGGKTLMEQDHLHVQW
mgnify:CR=1 FL=1